MKLQTIKLVKVKLSILKKKNIVYNVDLCTFYLNETKIRLKFVYYILQWIAFVMFLFNFSPFLRANCVNSL